MTLSNGHIYIPGEFADMSVDVTDPNNLLITTNSNQLQLVDISDPANMRMIFDQKKPAVIKLESPLPQIDRDYLTIDASNAGVILDGGKLKGGDGLLIYSSNNKVMGLQILHFLQNGIRVEGKENQIGGNRKTGIGPVGEGNLLSGNKLYGLYVGGRDQLAIGNLVGTDVTGTKANPTTTVYL